MVDQPLQGKPDDCNYAVYNSTAMEISASVSQNTAKLNVFTTPHAKTCHTVNLCNQKCSQCRKNTATHYQNIADIYRLAVKKLLHVNPNANEKEQKDAGGRELLHLARYIRVHGSKKSILLRAVCANQMCLLKAGMKTPDECVEWLKNGQPPNLAGINVRHGQDADLFDGVTFVHQLYRGYQIYDEELSRLLLADIRDGSHWMLERERQYLSLIHI